MRRRRRTALNEAVHELRRPLQAIALAGAGGSAGPGIERSLQLAASALARLDREINGGPEPVRSEPVAVGPLLADAVRRWGRAAAIGGTRLVLRLDDGDGGAGEQLAAVSGDRLEIAQALDNLLVNAIEHGGPRVIVSSRQVAGWLRISVRDCAQPLAVPAARGSSRAPFRERLFGQVRHGHGLRVVRRTAAAHGGRFSLRRSPGGTEARLELPLLPALPRSEEPA